MLEHYYLNLTYHLAVQNDGNTAPNPSVGALIVKEDHIVSWAYHELAGGPHAEVIALQRAGQLARDATLYCSLEPCAHYGKTPPCVDQIHRSGIDRVVFAVLDRNPLVSGKGQQALQQLGIRCERIGCPHIEAFYSSYFRTFDSGRPYIIAKAAITANGIIAPADRDSKWITNETSLKWVHQLRAQCDAILVGANTVAVDRPHLTVRADGVVRKPLRIVLDSDFSLDPKGCSLLETNSPILICGLETAPAGQERRWSGSGVQMIRFKNVHSLASNLFVEFGVRKMMVEGGQRTFTSLHTADLIDEYVLMVAPRLLTGNHFLNLLGGPEQSLKNAPRYSMDPPLEMDGDVIVRLRRRRYV